MARAVKYSLDLFPWTWFFALRRESFKELRKGPLSLSWAFKNMNLKGRWWFHDLEEKLYVTQKALINCDGKLNVWISGFECFVWSMFLPSVTSKEEMLYISKAKPNKKVSFALLSNDETSEQLIHVLLLWQDSHKNPKPQPTFASVEYIMADPVRSLEK